MDDSSSLLVADVSSEIIASPPASCGLCPTPQSSAAAAAAAAAATATATAEFDVTAVTDDEDDDDVDEAEEDGSLLGLRRAIGVELNVGDQADSSTRVESVTEILFDLALMSTEDLLGVNLSDPCLDTVADVSDLPIFGGVAKCDASVPLFENSSSISSVHETESPFSTINLTMDEACGPFLSGESVCSTFSGPNERDSLGVKFARTVTTSFF